MHYPVRWNHDRFTIYKSILNSDVIRIILNEYVQNTNRISYAPLLLVAITDNILMKIQCEIAGIVYSDLPNHKVNREADKGCFVGGCIHRMIHIHKDFVKDVYISFGYKKSHS
eukprot:412701_1